jgi:hypothetical protein
MRCRPALLEVVVAIETCLLAAIIPSSDQFPIPPVGVWLSLDVLEDRSREKPSMGLYLLSDMHSGHEGLCC